MRVALLVSGIPNATSAGGALTTWTVAADLLSRGHEVTAVCLVDPAYADPAGVTLAQRQADLEALGAEVTTVETESRANQAGRLRRLLAPTPEDVFPTLLEQPRFQAAVAAARPDVAFVYHWEALAASRGIAVPRLAAVGDPAHLPALYRFRLERKRVSRSSISRLLALQAQLRRQPGLMGRFLAECEAAGAGAAHHAEWFRTHGAPHCTYLRTPMPDPVGDGWRALRDRARTDGPPRILLVGHLRGVVTLEGLTLFARDTLPVLERELGVDGFEVRIVGGYEAPMELRASLTRPNVKFLGHLGSVEEEFLTADLLLVPNSIELGMRVRILTGLSFGCCIVTHAANRLGIPELEHDQNALIASSGSGLARAIVRALGDEPLRRRIESGARSTHDRSFSLAAAGGVIERTLAGISKPVAR